MTDLTGKTIRLYETCPKCEGTGYSGKYPEITCQPCCGTGTVTTHVKFEDMAEALREIAKAAVKQVGGEGKPATVDCPTCKGSGVVRSQGSGFPIANCKGCGGSGQVPA